MAAPSIIGIGTNSKAFTTTGTRTSSTYSYTIPANANTVIVVAMLDVAIAETNVITSLTLGSRSPSLSINPTPDTTNGLYGVKSVRINIYDVSGEAASTENIVPSFGSTSQRDIVGVVATDGYIQSANLSLDRSEQSVFLQSITGDPDNTRTLSILSFDATESFSLTNGTGTEIFKSENSGFSAYAISSTTVVNGATTIEYFPDTAGDLVGTEIILTSKPNPFADVNPTGDIISHDIITN